MWALKKNKIEREIKSFTNWKVSKAISNYIILLLSYFSLTKATANLCSEVNIVFNLLTDNNRRDTMAYLLISQIIISTI